MGKKVRYTKAAARFTLEHPEFWCYGNSAPHPDFYVEVVAAMATLMGEQIVGVTGQMGATSDTYAVTFTVPKVGKFWAYYELGKHIEYI